MVLCTQIHASQMMKSLRTTLGSRIQARGQGLAEYALLLALIAIVAVVALLFLGGQVSTVLSTVGDSI